MGFIILTFVLLLLLGALPAWEHSRKWGYRPSVGLGAVLIVILILMLLGYIPGKM